MIDWRESGKESEKEGIEKRANRKLGKCHLFLTQMSQITSSWMAQDPQIDVFNANIFLNTKFTHLWEPISPCLIFWINTVQYVPSGIMEGKKTHSSAAQPMNPRKWTPFPLRAGLCILSARCLTTWLENRPKLLLMIFALSLLIRVVTFFGLQDQLTERKNGSLGNLILKMWK